MASFNWQSQLSGDKDRIKSMVLGTWKALVNYRMWDGPKDFYRAPVIVRRAWTKVIVDAYADGCARQEYAVKSAIDATNYRRIRDYITIKKAFPGVH